MVAQRAAAELEREGQTVEQDAEVADRLRAVRGELEAGLHGLQSLAEQPERGCRACGFGVAIAAPGCGQRLQSHEMLATRLQPGDARREHQEVGVGVQRVADGSRDPWRGVGAVDQHEASPARRLRPYRSRVGFGGDQRRDGGVGADAADHVAARRAPAL